VRALIIHISACIGLISIDIAASSSATHALSGEQVQFEGASVKPSALRKRLAEAKGEKLADVPGLPLLGYLLKPEGPGPFPAVILMHGCNGMRQSIEGVWSERLQNWGYVTLVVDSFTTRNIKDTCSSDLPDRPYEAYGALTYLSAQTYVAADQVVLMGFSAGGNAALGAVQLGSFEKLMERKFAAAVAFYPACAEASGTMIAPTLILIGALDDWTKASDCQRMMTQRTGEGSPVKLIVYEGAYHGFIAADLQPGHEMLGHWLEYNEAATTRSIDDVRDFLETTIGK